MAFNLAGIGDCAMVFPAPFVGRIQKVESQWTDYNGHLNMAYYGVLFDRCADEAFELIGLGAEYVREASCSYFTLEAHLTYLRELRADEDVSISLQFLDCDAKRVHYVQEMFHASQGWLACVTENMVMHVDMKSRKSSPFPAAIFEKVKAMHVAHAGLPVPPQVGHRIGIPRKP